MNGDIVTYGAAGLAFIAITAVGLVFAGGERGKQSKRMKAISVAQRCIWLIGRASQTQTAMPKGE